MMSTSHSEVNLWKIKSGMISIVNVECSFVDWHGQQSINIPEALSSNDCHLKELRFAGTQGLSGVRLDHILTPLVLKQLAGSLEVLNGGGCGLVGTSALHGGRSTLIAAPRGPLHERGGSQIFFILTCAQY